MITKWINVDEEDEMEIGYPTDVCHVSHIGWDSSPSSAPSWVRYFYFLATIDIYDFPFIYKFTTIIDLV